MDIWIWQQMLTPHMAYFAESLSSLGHNVTYATTQLVSEERKQQGWQVPVLKNVNLKVMTSVEQISPLLSLIDSNAIHLCEGIRGNGLVRAVQSSLAFQGIKYWVLMETVDDASFVGMIRRPMYSYLIRSRINEIRGILAIGYKTTEWLLDRGCPLDKLFSFAYFLQQLLILFNFCLNDTSLVSTITAVDHCVGKRL